jgi:hypothetical protein
MTGQPARRFLYGKRKGTGSFDQSKYFILPLKVQPTTHKQEK